MKFPTIIVSFYLLFFLSFINKSKLLLFVGFNSKQIISHQKCSYYHKISWTYCNVCRIYTFGIFLLCTMCSPIYKLILIAFSARPSLHQPRLKNALLFDDVTCSINRKAWNVISLTQIGANPYHPDVILSLLLTEY